MNTVVDFILGSSNKKNGKTNSVNKNIPEIASAKKTLSEFKKEFAAIDGTRRPRIK